ncbi:hypothetical protein N473_07465 [Pseudoalteromonas luteoviolacea CPMOR-1]|uniref:Uncharacterized protein n=1 Tax=Pseudoalteromonas luteoviolacea CPMOR-1 TaxID=1365248 RepID=A0A167NGX0_9GAMM|nr:hypothetical protein [Pseudoalteromonas luteoviolacea]KZN68255.1 hypothetical protein N473_07465 [Pseudoalteromonas luteoviolacea CPMOR-1]
MKYLFLPVFALSVNSAVAASSIKQLDVLGQTVTFTLAEPKSHQVPNCVSAQNHEKWAVNLNSLQGQAVYSLLVTAIAKEQLVSVQSANACESITDVEQVKNISLMVNNAIVNSNVPAIYDGSGMNKVGKIVRFQNGIYEYVPIDGATDVERYINYTTDSFYFLDSECKGELYSQNFSRTYRDRKLYSERFGSFFGYSDPDDTNNYLNSQGAKTVYQYNNGACLQQNGTASGFSYGALRLVPTTHPLCGDKPCIIK